MFFCNLLMSYTCGLVTIDVEYTKGLDTTHANSHLVMAWDGIFDKLTTNEVCGIVSTTMTIVDISKDFGFFPQTYEGPIVFKPIEKQTCTKEETIFKDDMEIFEPHKVVKNVNIEVQKDLQDGSVQSRVAIL